MELLDFTQGIGGDPQRPIDDFNELSDSEGTAVVLARLFVLRAGDLWDALLEVPLDDPVKPFLDVLTDIALTAGLQLLGV